MRNAQQQQTPAGDQVAATARQHTGCAAMIDRRTFLGNSAAAVTAALVAIGLTPDIGFAGTVSAIVGEVRAVERSYTLPNRDGVWIDAESSVAVAIDQALSADSDGAAWASAVAKL